MEFVTATNKTKYESLLEKIESQHQLQEKLKKDLNDKNSELIALSLLLKKNFPKDHIFRVQVKLFDSPNDVVFRQTTPESESNLHFSLENKILYRVDIYISKVFKERISDDKLFYNIRIKNSRSCVQRSVPHKVKKSLHATSPDVSVVIPFSNATETSIVDVSLLYCTENYWPELKITSIPIDLSFQFSDKKKLQYNLNQRIVDICRMYHSEIDRNILKPRIHQYEYSCKFDKVHLMKVLLSNCYHRINPRINSVITVLDKCIVIRLYSPTNNLCVVKLDSESNKLTIDATADDLYYLKKLFVTKSVFRGVKITNAWRTKFKRLDEELKEELEYGRVNFTTLKRIFADVQKLLFQLPI